MFRNTHSVYVLWSVVYDFSGKTCSGRPFLFGSLCVKADICIVDQQNESKKIKFKS
ncbi:hypothetical protein DXC86_06385 [Bacteroides fragilis]|nr:hypothetical protein DXC86_06385 [Bacteroides fragilis]